MRRINGSEQMEKIDILRILKDWNQEVGIEDGQRYEMPSDV
jgi:hypothetical protein